jgi:hypothetical protein
MKTEMMDTPMLRELYLKLRKEASRIMATNSPGSWNSFELMVSAKMVDVRPTPQHWVEAAREVVEELRYEELREDEMVWLKERERAC